MTGRSGAPIDGSSGKMSPIGCAGRINSFIQGESSLEVVLITDRASEDLGVSIDDTDEPLINEYNSGR